MVFVISVVSAYPALNPLVCGCLSRIRRQRDSRRLRGTLLQTIGLANHKSRNAPSLYPDMNSLANFIIASNLTTEKHCFGGGGEMVSDYRCRVVL